MNCPIDGTQLVMSERSNVEIDYCPQCRGVWLDRGELDKIVERAQSGTAPAPYGQTSRGHGYDQRPRRKESWLGDLFG